MPPAANANETYCTFTLASDVTAGGLPLEDEIAKDLESNDATVSTYYDTDERECRLVCSCVCVKFVGRQFLWSESENGLPSHVLLSGRSKEEISEL